MIHSMKADFLPKLNDIIVAIHAQTLMPISALLFSKKSHRANIFLALFIAYGEK
jgi:hypothetical protein